MNELAEAPCEIPLAAAEPHWWLYLLLCSDGRTYVGITLDVAARYQVHASGKGAKFTRANPPRAILGVELHANKSAAMRAEHALKRLGREARLEWSKQRPCASIAG